MAHELSTLASGLSFAEAPRWHRGALWFSDMHANRVVRIDSAGALHVVATFKGPVSGLGWLPDDRLLVVSMHDRCVLRVEHDGSTVEHASIANVAAFHANDMVVASDGTAYVGNFGYSIFPREPPRSTALARITPHGIVTEEGRDLWFPNGMIITRDGGTLIVAETAAGRLTAFDRAADGSLSRQRTWADLGEAERPDGICMDVEGCIWAAMPHRRSFIRIREGGTILDTIEIEDMALACVLGGSDRRTLYLLASAETEPARCRSHRAASVRTTRVEVPGAGVP